MFTIRKVLYKICQTDFVINLESSLTMSCLSKCLGALINHNTNYWFSHWLSLEGLDFGLFYMLKQNIRSFLEQRRNSLITSVVGFSKNSLRIPLLSASLTKFWILTREPQCSVVKSKVKAAQKHSLVVGFFWRGHSKTMWRRWGGIGGPFLLTLKLKNVHAEVGRWKLAK